jgi:hypothetical protein
MPSVDWLDILDIKRACANCRTDIFGDWYRDPWAWPELEWLADHPDPLVQRLNSNGVRRLAPINVAKENFVLRPASVLDIVDRLVYQALVDRLSVKLLAGSPSWMFSWRLSRQQPLAGRYSDQGDEWSRYRDHLIELSGMYAAALTTDIVSYFASIPPEHLGATIEQRSGSGAVTTRLVDMVLSWGKAVGRTGLPQRAWASSILANMYLRPVDDVLRQFGLVDDGWFEPFEESAAARWVDDIWLFNDNSGRLREAQISLQQCMEDLGLQINAGKTRLLEGDEVIDEARNLEHSAVDVGLEVEPPDTEPLSELVDRLLSRPADAPQTSIRFVAVRIKEHQLPGALDRFVEAAPRMPQGAAALSRLFRETGKWRELDVWYRDHVKSAWNVIEWAAAQLGTMFPANWAASAAARDLVAEYLSPNREISVFALAAQRMAAWDAASARSILRDIAPKLADPHLRRIAGLAALNAGEDAAWVTKLLGEFEENRPTLQFLSERGFRAVTPVADFQGS